MFQSGDERERGHAIFAATRDDEGEREIESVGGGDAGVEGGGVGDGTDVCGGAEEGVVAGFDGEDGGGAGDEGGVGESEGGGDVDDGADADAGDDVGEGEEIGGGGDGEDVGAGGEGFVVEVGEDVLGCLDVDEFLGLDFGDDVDGAVETVIVPFAGEVGETGGEEGGFEVFEEVDALEVGDCGVGDVRR